MCYIAIPLYVVGFVVIGLGYQSMRNVAEAILGWGIGEVAVMMNTVAICTSSNLSLR